jgi:hypothetical protein
MRKIEVTKTHGSTISLSSLFFYHLQRNTEFNIQEDIYCMVITERHQYIMVDGVNFDMCDLFDYLI